MTTTTKRQRGEGSIYLRGSTYWLKFYQDGDVVRMSSGSEDEKVARRMLREHVAKVALKQPLVVRSLRVGYKELRDDLLSHYRATGSRDVREAQARLRHVDDFFTGWRAAQISSTAITEYIVERQTAGAANGTVNREVEVLLKMLRLGMEHHKVALLPIVHKPKESAPRAGFFEREAFEAVRRLLPLDLQVAVTIAYTYGWRMQSEVLALELRQVDLAAGTIRLDPGSTKNDDGRVVYLTPELVTLLKAQVERVHGLGRELGRVIPWLFPLFPAPRLRSNLVGEQRLDFTKLWKAVCRQAGYPGMLLHDFRRTAVRNMEAAGVPRSVAMKITGHRTETVYRRYAIVSPADLQRAADLIASSGTISGTPAIVTPLPGKRTAMTTRT
jgi:integrase